MYNCKVTKNKALTVRQGLFGRPWRENSKILFYKTVLDDDSSIEAEGWEQ